MDFPTFRRPESFDFAGAILTEIDERLSAALARPGLRPRPVPGMTRTSEDRRVRLSAPHLRSVSVPEDLAALLDDPSTLEGRPATEWPGELIALWQLGHVYLVDAASHVPPEVEITARKLIVTGTQLGRSGRVAGDHVLLQDSIFVGHYAITGACAIIGSFVDEHAELGHVLILDDCRFAPFIRIAGSVRMRSTMGGAHLAVWGGGHHFEFYPLARHDLQAAGAAIGPFVFLGQHVSILTGARIGEGVLVASGTMVNRDVGEHVIVAGSTARTTAIDSNLAGMGDDEAASLGREQGPLAVALPAYGEPRIGFRDDRTVEIEHPRHRGGEALCAFHRGALEAFFAWLLPDHRAQVRATSICPVRFEVRFDAPVGARAALTHDRVIELGEAVPGPPLPPVLDLALSVLEERPMSFATFADKLYKADLGSPLPSLGAKATMVAEELLLGLSARGLLASPVLPELRHAFARDRLRPYWEAFADPAAHGPLPPLEQTGAPSRAPQPANPAASTPDVAPYLEGLLRRYLPSETAVQPLARDASFRRLGLASLSFAEFAVEVENDFGVTVDLVEHDTIDKLAEAIGGRGRE